MATRNLRTEAAAFYTRLVDDTPAYGASVAERATFQLRKAEALEYVGIANPACWALLADLANRARYEAGAISGDYQYTEGR